MLHIKFDNQIQVAQNDDATPFARGIVFAAEAGLETMVGKRVQVWQDQIADVYGLEGQICEVLADLSQERKFEGGGSFVRLYDVSVERTYSDEERKVARRAIMIAQHLANQAAGVKTITTSPAVALATVGAADAVQAPATADVGF